MKPYLIGALLEGNCTIFGRIAGANIIRLILCAVIAGCDEWTTIEEYTNTKLDFLKTFLKLKNDIPSHSTFGDIFAKGAVGGPPLIGFAWPVR